MNGRIVKYIIFMGRLSGCVPAAMGKFHIYDTDMHIDLGNGWWTAH